MRKKVLEKNELNFLKDKDLKKTIEDSIQYVRIAYKQAKDSEKALYKEETYRVVILYIVSIIEAVLLYVFNLRNEKIDRLDYNYISPVPQEFKHSKLPHNVVVIAVQKKTTKNNKRIGFVELIDFMKTNCLIEKKLAQEILDINNVRNTFHFTKPRNKIICEIKIVENALELLVKVLKNAPKMIVFKK